jgi:hypothetical protein
MLKQLGGHKVFKRKKMTPWPLGGLQVKKEKDLVVIRLSLTV